MVFAKKNAVPIIVRHLLVDQDIDTFLDWMIVLLMIELIDDWINWWLNLLMIESIDDWIDWWMDSLAFYWLGFPISIFF